MIQFRTISSYRDYLHEDTAQIKLKLDDEIPKCKRKGPRGGVALPFPVRLYEMLQSAQTENFEHIVSWRPHGRAFVVHNAREFVQHIMPRFFHQTKIASFQRQLNLYGFHRLTKEPDSGCHYHDLFLRGRPELCTFIVRVRAKECRLEEPNLWSFPASGFSQDAEKPVNVKSLMDASCSSMATTNVIAKSTNERFTAVTPEVDGRVIQNQICQQTQNPCKPSITSESKEIEIISKEDLAQVLYGWVPEVSELDVIGLYFLSLETEDMLEKQTEQRDSACGSVGRRFTSD